MRRFPVLSRLLLALGFLAVQAMAVAHASSHELKAESSAACEVCMLAHAAGGTPAVIDTAGIPVPRGEAPAAPAPRSVAQRRAALPPSRGPPALPA
ncbi:MAG TPA: DUF2946 family protein [Nevskia sp.]|nr:DUF2946 family protein [Nevskia sp.]